MHLFYRFAARLSAERSAVKITAAFAAQMGVQDADPVAIGLAAMRTFLARLDDPRDGAGNDDAGHQDAAQGRCRKTEQFGERQRCQTQAGKPEGGRTPLLVRSWIHGSDKTGSVTGNRV